MASERGELGGEWSGERGSKRVFLLAVAVDVAVAVFLLWVGSLMIMFSNLISLRIRFTN